MEVLFFLLFETLTFNVCMLLISSHCVIVAATYPWSDLLVSVGLPCFTINKSFQKKKKKERDNDREREIVRNTESKGGVGVLFLSHNKHKQHLLALSPPYH